MFSELISELDALENHLKTTKEFNIDEQESIYFAKKAAYAYRRRHNEKEKVEYLELDPNVLEKLMENLKKFNELFDKPFYDEQYRDLVALEKCRRIAQFLLLFWTK
jgi:hypothetical protein